MTNGLEPKSFWMTPLLAAVLVACVGVWADSQIRRVMREELRHELETVSDANVTALEIWMANQKRMAAALAEEPRLRSLVVDLLNPPARQDNAGRYDYFMKARQLLLGDRLRERLQTLDYTVAQLVDTNYQIVFDTGRGHSRMGSEISEDLLPKYEELFESNLPVVIMPFKVTNAPAWGRNPRRSRQARPAPPGPRESSVMQVAAPVQDTNGVTRGALALLIKPDSEFTRILSVARLGATGETFAFDADGIMISRSRFDAQLKKLGLLEDKPDASSALDLRLADPGGDLTAGYPRATNADLPLIRMVAQAISNGAGVELDPSRDYRGVPVIGAWRWLPNYGFGVATKIDASEAYHALSMLRLVFVVLFLMLVLASMVILILSYYRLIWRRRISEAELKARRLGQYTLAEKLGEGGMGIVYKAHHALLRRQTALKLLTPDRAHPEAVQRFEREVRLTCRLAHPNTIQVYDYGRTPEGIFYYAMEYLVGLNLAELVEQYGPQPEGRVIHLLIQACDSLAEAHSLGLIHRDIKPSNIFICDRAGIPDMVKVLDFGLVKSFEEPEEPGTAPAAGGVVGTPVFISPEAIEDAGLADARSDLYSLGAVGYFLLTGAFLFEGGSVEEICRKRLTQRPVAPSVRTGKAFCPGLESAILRCLERDPDARPQSAGELISLLAASPCAGDWTPQRRFAWWAAHWEAAAKIPQQAPHPPTSAAVDIAVTDRSP